MRGVPRWTAVVAVLAVAATVCAFTVHRAIAPAELVVQLEQSTLPADGFSATELSVHSSNGRELRGLHIDLETPHRLALESLRVSSDRATATLQAGVMAGEAKVRITAPGLAAREVALQTTADFGDAVGDGTPDFLRLHDPADREAFRRWFTLLAESQYYLHHVATTAGALPLQSPQNRRWLGVPAQGTPDRGANAAPEIVDCAALLRFAYREALREHDAAWSQAMALPAPVTAGDIRQYQYPYTPLGAAIFRVRDGGFVGDDLQDGAFAEFADAETLWRRNTFSMGRSLSRARPGDLLFFRQDGGRMPFHAMIFLGRSQLEPGSEQFVVYHTGPSGGSTGEIKRLSITELANYPDARWRPIASNPAFLGVYRWNILRGAE